MKDQKYPEPTVGAIILNNKGEVLVLKSPKWNTYTIPGGHVELNETMEDALRREVKEEIGLDVNVIRMLNVSDAIRPREFNYEKHFIFIDFLCRAKHTDVRVDKKEITDFMWVKPEKAIEMVNDHTKKDLEIIIKEKG
ncbi:MAG: NUDIX domain-containing protein [Candidatus Aenigmarchaeota archaeon]|nr:NUDIX domain-containing protein [Candidatus Aenigmarchaeota archaeon]NIQ17543.1 NUDIX domain-containing protein [Candidatus Aenigmarchaeota archaeon]NIS73121.1 NUDIX domain-containing protein [Candidatus Aenigmarchaeota archaeon]